MKTPSALWRFRILAFIMLGLLLFVFYHNANNNALTSMSSMVELVVTGPVAGLILYLLFRKSIEFVRFLAIFSGIIFAALWITFWGILESLVNWGDGNNTDMDQASLFFVNLSFGYFICLFFASLAERRQSYLGLCLLAHLCLLAGLIHMLSLVRHIADLKPCMTALLFLAPFFIFPTLMWRKLYQKLHRLPMSADLQV